MSRPKGLPGFRITGGRGFHITFENGYTVSVQFGAGNYCEHYDGDYERGKELAAAGSVNAEAAVWAKGGDMIQYGDWSDTVGNRLSPADVLELLNWAAAQPASVTVPA
jgi:hypothetical protein